jgi:EmrB/QacA subfamily drug resistance transporter
MGLTQETGGKGTSPADARDRVQVTDRWRHRLLVEPRRPPAVAHHRHAHWFVVATVCTGAFMGQLDASIVTVALPSLQQAFHASLAAVTWVGLSYLLVLVAMVTAVGRLSDMAGRKLVYTYGFGVFIIGSALCGLAPSLAVLDGSRALQAVGAAMLQANSVAIIYLAVPRSSLGRAIGVQGAAQALGLALGPAVGGLLLAAAGWRLIFLVNVPVGLLGVAAAWLLVPRSRHLADRARFDWAGLGLFVPAVAVLIGALSAGDRLGWASPAIVAALAAGAVLGTGFVAREHRAGAPMLDLSLFRRPGFSTGVVGGLASYLVLFGVLVVTPLFLERGLQVGTGRAGLELTVMPLFLGLAALLAGRMSDRSGGRRLTVTGMAVVTATLAVLAASTPGQAVLLVGLALVGTGLGLFTPANNAAILASAPKDRAGVAAGVLNMARGLGTAVGLALSGLVYDLAPTPRGGFQVQMELLAAVSAAALVLAAARRERPRPDGRAAYAEAAL